MATPTPRQPWRSLRLLALSLSVLLPADPDSACGENSERDAQVVEAAAADSATRPIDPERISGLVSGLDAETRAERSAAESELMGLGPAVLDHLPPPDLLESAAAQDALRRIRSQLELQAAEDSVRPSRVVLAGRSSVAAAAAELERQTGNAVRLELPEEAGLQQIDLHLDHVPFWRAVNELTREAGIGWDVDASTGAVLLVDTPTIPQRVAFSVESAYAVAVESISRRGEALRVEFQILAEPRLRPLFVSIADADFTAVAGEERLSLFSPKARTELPMTSRGPARFAVLFQLPHSDGVAQSLRIEGEVTVHTAAAPTEVQFRDLSSRSPVARRRGGVTVTLERARWLSNPDDHGARIRMAVAYDAGGPAFESHRTWIYHNEVYLEAPDGKRFPVNDGFDTTAQANGGVVLEYRFKDLPDLRPAEWQLVYVAPTLLVDVPVEFEFPVAPLSDGDVD